MRVETFGKQLKPIMIIARRKWICGCWDEIEIDSFACSLIDGKHWFDVVTEFEEDGNRIVVYEEKDFKESKPKFLHRCFKIFCKHPKND